jgi:hypothetical protein
MKCKSILLATFLFAIFIVSLPQDVQVTDQNQNQELGSSPETSDLLPYIPEIRIVDIDDSMNEVTVDVSFTMLDQGMNPAIGLGYNVTNSVAYIFHIITDNYDTVDDWAFETYLYLEAVVMACNWGPNNYTDVFPDAEAILYDEFDSFQTDIAFGPYIYDNLNISRITTEGIVLDDDYHHTFAMVYLNWTAPFEHLTQEPLGVSLVTVSRDELKGLTEDREIVENKIIAGASEDFYLWIAQYGWFAFIGVLAAMGAIVFITRKNSI